METWLDKAIARVAPGVAFRRIQSRIAYDHLVRSYNGATTGRRSAGWNSAGTSAKAEVSKDIQNLIKNSRNLIQNNPYASLALERWTANVIGHGFVAKFDKDEEQKLFESWTKYCDADWDLDFAGIQSLVINALYESGGVLIRHRFRRPEDNLEVPYQIQVLEIDYLDLKKNQDLGANGFIYNGIQFDALGRKVAYWLFSSHPGDNFTFSRALTSKPISAEFISHIYVKNRPGQILGVPALSSVILRMNDLDEYEDAELMRKKIEACFSVFVTGSGEGGTLSSTSSMVDGQRRETVEPGMIHYNRNGESVTFAAPKSVGGYDAYMRQQLHAVAAGAKLTYEQMTGDLSQVNFSSLRSGTQEFRKSAEKLRWLTFVPKFLEPVKANFLRAAFLNRKLRSLESEVTWTPPKWEYVNPVEDVETTKELCLGGLTSISSAIRERGESPEAVFKEIAEERKLLESLGLNFDTIMGVGKDENEEGTDSTSKPPSKNSGR